MREVGEEWEEKSMWRRMFRRKGGGGDGCDGERGGGGEGEYGGCCMKRTEIGKRKSD